MYCMRRRVGGRSHDHDGVGHGASFFQGLDDLGDGGALLADGDVDADEIAALVVDDGVKGDGGLAGLAVADEQFALAAADGNHGIDGLDAGGHGLAHRLTVNDAGGDALDRIELGGDDGTLVIDGLTERVDDAANDGVADGHAHDGSGALDLVAFLDLGGFTEKHGADLILFEVHGQARDAVGEGEQFASHDLVQAMNAGDAVANGDHGANFIDGDLVFVVFDLLTNELCNLVCFNLGHVCSQLPLPAIRRQGT